MLRIISIIFIALLIGGREGHAMELNTALKLVQYWGSDSKDMRFIGQLKVDAQGAFLTKAAGAFFRYEPKAKQLLVSGLVGHNIKLHTKHPSTWEKQLRASQRERPTIGEGYLELYTQNLFHLDPDVVLLTKAFKDDGIEPAQFVVETRWLLNAAYYWFMKRHSEVMVTPEDELIRQAPGINERMLRERPRPW